MKFLNEQRDGERTIYTSARPDPNNGNQPITDVNLKSSEIRNLRETRTVTVINQQQVEGSYVSDWINIKGYSDITILSNALVDEISLNWSTDGIYVDDTEELIEITPITTVVAADYVQLRIVSTEPQTITAKIYLKS